MNATQKRLNLSRHNEAGVWFGPLWSALATRLRFEDGVTTEVTTGDTGQPAPGPGDTPNQPAPDPAGTPQNTTGETPPLAPAEAPAAAPAAAPGPVPYDRFSDVNERMKKAEEKAQQYEQFILSQRQGQPQQQQGQPQPGGPPTQQDVLQKLGMTSDDLFTDDGLRRYTTGLTAMMQESSMNMVQTLRNEMAQMMNQSKTPDLGQVVGSQNPVTGQFQYGSALQTYINAHPDQSQALAYMAQLPQTQQIVYDLVTRDPAYQQAAQGQQQINQQQVAQQVAQINSRPVNASELAQAGTLDEATIRGNWTDEQVRANVERARQAVG